MRVYPMCSKCGEVFERYAGDSWQKMCWSCWHAAHPTRVNTDYGFREHYQAVRMLSHPDRHGQSRLSVTTTVWLNSLADFMERE